VLISILVPVSIASAASPSVDNIKVFQNYEETGDWLIVCVYNISGGDKSDCANTSCFNVDTYPWFIQLIDSTGTPITNYPIKQEGMRPFGMEISAAMATSLTWGGNYSVKIYGNYLSEVHNASRAINATDWKGQVSFGGLDTWVIQQAKTMETFDATTYISIGTVNGEYRELLNTDGAYLFDTGIPYLSTYRPDIFEVTVSTVSIGYQLTNSSKTYEVDLYNNWDVALGPDVSAALDSAAPYFGFTGADRGRMVGALLTFMGFISLALVSKTIAFLIIIGGVVIGVFPMSLVFVLVFILLVVLVRSLFWSST
jgi:hypothetical protein